MNEDTALPLEMALKFCRFWANRSGEEANRRAKAWWYMAEASRDDSIESNVLKGVAELLLMK